MTDSLDEILHGVWTKEDATLWMQDPKNRSIRERSLYNGTWLNRMHWHNQPKVDGRVMAAFYEVDPTVREATDTILKRNELHTFWSYALNNIHSHYWIYAATCDPQRSVVGDAYAMDILLNILSFAKDADLLYMDFQRFPQEWIEHQKMSGHHIINMVAKTLTNQAFPDVDCLGQALGRIMPHSAVLLHALREPLHYAFQFTDEHKRVHTTQLIKRMIADWPASSIAKLETLTAIHDTLYERGHTPESHALYWNTLHATLNAAFSQREHEHLLLYRFESSDQI